MEGLAQLTKCISHKYIEGSQSKEPFWNSRILRIIVARGKEVIIVL
jgi:hypothetical protein